jgi:polar amino acid transport system permease protein
MTWSWVYAIQILPDLLMGVWMTILVTFASAALAITLGLAIAIFENTSGPAGRWFVRFVVELFRGVPILVLIYFGFYVLPEVGIRLPAIGIGIFVLGVVYAAFCSEVYRGSLIAIPTGLRDACVALGLSRRVTWTHVLIPIAVRQSMPALINYILVLYRQSAFLFAIGVPVLLGTAQTAGYQSFRYLEPYTLAGLLYLVLNLPFVYALSRYKSKSS